MDEQLAAMLFQPWSNGSCLGYVIKAMENLNYEPKEVAAVVSEIKWIFDWASLEYADKHYCKSPY